MRPRARAWLMRSGVALAAAMVAPLAGCRRDSGEAEAGARTRVRAELLVAPLVDDHPWVIAFLTNVSITRPPGADARLDGRTGPRGLRHPEPIIEGESREALAAALHSYEAEHPRSPELSPVWQRTTSESEAAWRLYFVDRSRGFIVDEQAEMGIVAHDHGPSVHVYLGASQREQLRTLSAAQQGRRLAFVLDDEVLMLPVVFEPIPDGEVQLVTEVTKDPRQTAPALLERLSTPGAADP